MHEKHSMRAQALKAMATFIYQKSLIFFMIGCPLCGRLLKNRSGLAGHMRIVHGVTKRVVARVEPPLERDTMPFKPNVVRGSSIESPISKSEMAYIESLKVQIAELEKRISQLKEGSAKKFGEDSKAIKKDEGHCPPNQREEKTSIFPRLPPLPPLPPPPFPQTINEKIRRLNET